MSDYKSSLHDISSIDKNIKIACITAEFNKDFTKALESINIQTLKDQGFSNIDCFSVPGAFEIPAMTKRILLKQQYDLILTFGVVVRGDTPHFDYVCSETARGILLLSLEYQTPIIFGVLTCNTQKQVEERIKDVYAISGLNLLAECKKL